MKAKTRTLLPPIITATAILLGLASLSARAEFVYVTSLTADPNCVGQDCQQVNTDVNPTTGYSIYNDNSFGAYTTAKSTAEGKPTTAGAHYFSTSFTNNSSPELGITLSPVLSVPGGVYRIHHVFSASAGNVSSDVVLGVTNTAGCTLSFTNTDRFQAAYGNSTWQFLGYLTNDPGSANPVITFYYQSGTVDAGAQRRLLVDTFRFSNEFCLDVPVVRPSGPIATNLSTVGVTGASTEATKLTVYQNSGSGMVAIGSTNVSNPTGTVQVPVSGLTKGGQVAATQTIGGQEGCVPPNGIIVGGGANPSVRIAFSIRSNPALTGPVGAAYTGPADIFFLGSAGTLAGAAPDGGAVLHPSTNWQTVAFTRGDPYAPTDPYVIWNAATSGLTDFLGDFGGFDGLGIACEGDTGPIEMYLDDLANGTNGIVQNWETPDAGTEKYQFNYPSYSGTTAGFILATPNVSVVTTNVAFNGQKSLKVSWQFNGMETNRWLRLVTSGATNVNAVANPLLDLNQPISIKVLLLPPGVTLTPSQPGPITIKRNGNRVELSWAGSFQLQSSTKVDGTYTDVPGITNAPYSVEIGTESMFYRLR